MMSGQIQLNMDAKGRLMVPTRFREDLGDSIIVTQGLDNCIFVFPQEAWEELQAKIKKLPIAESRFVKRMLIGSKETLEVDKQGRILIPATLRKMADLEKDVVFMGVDDRAEIWSSKALEDYNKKTFVEDSDKVAQQMAELGL